MVEVGADVSHFKPGDEVYSVSEFTHLGTNAQRQLVDKQRVGGKPKLFRFANAAALPLTSITAWEILFDSYGLNEDDGAGDALLVVDGAGGVGLIMIQPVKQLTGLTIVATATRPETEARVRKMGANRVVNHKNPLDEEMKAPWQHPALYRCAVRYGQSFAPILELIKPRGHIAVIDDPPNLHIDAIKLKTLSFSWEFMFARSLFKADDMEAQGKLLDWVADLVDQGKVVSTANKNAAALNEANLRTALELLRRHRDRKNCTRGN